MDFLAASVALMEAQHRIVDTGKVTGNMNDKQRVQFNRSLDFYRKEYGKKQQATVE
ncbi:glycogen synthesis protein [Enterobacillus tribolii]|nr:glycogen synthesis protein [Enterobacillus tribolii]